MGKRPFTPKEKYQLLGWAMFTVCALLYTLDSLAKGNWLVGLGSVLFLVACVVFMVPLVGRLP
ncbi:MAG: hypothetical protein ACLFTK_16195 [Anaerolineales bacterium]